MEKILDRDEPIRPKRDKTWMIIILTNAILLGSMFLIFISTEEAGKLIVAGLGAVSLLAINPIMTLVSLLFIDSKEWQKWFIAACIVSLIVSILYFLFYFEKTTLGKYNPFSLLYF